MTCQNWVGVGGTGFEPNDVSCISDCSLGDSPQESGAESGAVAIQGPEAHQSSLLASVISLVERLTPAERAQLMTWLVSHPHQAGQ